MEGDWIIVEEAKFLQSQKMTILSLSSSSHSFSVDLVPIKRILTLKLAYDSLKNTKKKVILIRGEWTYSPLRTYVQISFKLFNISIYKNFQP